MSDCSVFCELVLFYLRQAPTVTTLTRCLQVGPWDLLYYVEWNYVIAMLIINKWIWGKESRNKFHLYYSSAQRLSCFCVLYNSVRRTDRPHILCVCARLSLTAGHGGSGLNFAVKKQYFLGQLNNSELRFPSVIHSLVRQRLGRHVRLLTGGTLKQAWVYALICIVCVLGSRKLR